MFQYHLFCLCRSSWKSSRRTIQTLPTSFSLFNTDFAENIPGHILPYNPNFVDEIPGGPTLYNPILAEDVLIGSASYNSDLVEHIQPSEGEPLAPELPLTLMMLIDQQPSLLNPTTTTDETQRQSPVAAVPPPYSVTVPRNPGSLASQHPLSVPCVDVDCLTSKPLGPPPPAYSELDDESFGYYHQPTTPRRPRDLEVVVNCGTILLTESEAPADAVGRPAARTSRRCIDCESNRRPAVLAAIVCLLCGVVPGCIPLILAGNQTYSQFVTLHYITLHYTDTSACISHYITSRNLTVHIAISLSSSTPGS